MNFGNADRGNYTESNYFCFRILLQNVENFFSLNSISFKTLDMLEILGY